MVPSVDHTSANAASSNPEASLASLKRRGRIKAIYILALVSSISLLCYYDRFVVAIVAQSIKADLHQYRSGSESPCIVITSNLHAIFRFYYSSGTYSSSSAS